ncbi:MAG: YceD family protein [Lysobacteraceae bacterium]
MSGVLPESVDVWRAALAGRLYEGRAPLARFRRLLPSLNDDDGDCAFRIVFSREASGQALVRVEAEAGLPLQCQRSLERFVLPVRIEQTLGLLRNEAEQAALPPDVEPVLAPADGMLDPLDLVEDELILALPVMPVAPGSLPVEQAFGDGIEPEPAQPNPFAALAALKSPRR